MSKAKQDGTITMNLGGEDREFRMDLNAMATFEDLTGKSLLNANHSNDMTAKDIRAMLFCGLKSQNSKLTIEEVGSWLHIGNMNEVADILIKAIGEASPEASGESGGGDGDPLAG